MAKQVITIHENGSKQSADTAAVLKKKLQDAQMLVTDTYTDQTDLIVCIGGDGSFLRAAHDTNFPSVPFIGINTGHLGFFQEIKPEQLDDFIAMYISGNYSIQELNTVKATVDHDGKTDTYYGINEIIVRGNPSNIVHLDISLGDNFIESFSGDGILVATASGSTAYNYSLRGSIVDPRLKLLQVTPMAPTNTVAYRTFTSSILLPSDMTLGVTPEKNEANQTKPLIIINDGFEHIYDSLDAINIELSERSVKLIRFESYSFWDKVKEKFL